MPCLVCGKPLNTGRMYCSYACRGVAVTTAVTYTCPICGKSVTKGKSKVKPDERHFCGRSCARRARAIPPADRFWKLVDKSDPDGCWTWTGYINRGGYGKFLLRDRKPVSAHRFAYELIHGPIPDGLSVCHTCDNRNCVRPDHLFLGTPAENASDRDTKGRWSSGPKRHSAKLTESDVREIRQLAASGMPQSDIGKRFGVHEDTVIRIVRRKTWQNVT
jgi:hypothetical protein